MAKPNPAPAWIFNADARLVQLAYSEPPEPDGYESDVERSKAHVPCVRHRAVKTLKLAPGLNLIKPEDMAPFGVVDAVKTLKQLTFTDPLTLPDHMLESYIARTGSRQAIRSWRAIETRPDAIALLDERIASFAVAPTPPPAPPPRLERDIVAAFECD